MRDFQSLQRLTRSVCTDLWRQSTPRSIGIFATRYTRLTGCRSYFRSCHQFVHKSKLVAANSAPNGRQSLIKCGGGKFARNDMNACLYPSDVHYEDKKRGSTSFLKREVISSELAIARPYNPRDISLETMLRSRAIHTRVEKKINTLFRLSRVKEQTGTLLLFWPCTWGIALAAGVTGASVCNTLFYSSLCGIGALLARSAGCIINDMWDRDIDKMVARTRERPLASGKVSLTEGGLWLGAHISAGFIVLQQFNPVAIGVGLISLVPVALYPLMKRITFFPQVFLGLTFNWGVLLGWTAVIGSFGPLWAAPLSLYLGGVCWTTVYDTIYAHQDRVDDIKADVKSTAVHWGDDTKKWLSIFSGGTIGFFAIAGLVLDMHWPYALAIGTSGAHMARQIYVTELANPKSCKKAFQSNIWIGPIMLFGILGSNQYKKRDSKQIASTHMGTEDMQVGNEAL